MAYHSLGWFTLSHQDNSLNFINVIFIQKHLSHEDSYNT